MRVTFEIAARTVFLKATNGAEETGDCVAVGGVFDGYGVGGFVKGRSGASGMHG
jgi:hypothetical protein